jgi:hypothetical protein
MINGQLASVHVHATGDFALLLIRPSAFLGIYIVLVGEKAGVEIKRVAQPWACHVNVSS